VVHLVGVHEQARNLALREVQPVLPYIPLLDVVVFLELRVVGHHREIAGVEPEETLDGKEGAEGLRRHGGVVDGPGEQPAAVGGVDRQERVTEHGRGTVDVGRGEDEAYRLGTDVVQDVVESPALGDGQPGRVDGQLFPEPRRARDEAAGRVLRLIPRGLEQRQDRRLHLGRRVVLPGGGQEEFRVVHEAAQARHAGLVVQKREPVRVLGELQSARLLDEGFRVGVCLCGDGSSKRGESQPEDKKEGDATHAGEPHPRSIHGAGPVTGTSRRVRDF